MKPVVNGTPACASRNTVNANANTGRRRARPVNEVRLVSPSEPRDTTATTANDPITSTEYKIRYSTTDGMPGPGSVSPAPWAAASTPTRMKPAWLIDEYASIRLTLSCTTARTEPTTSVTRASTQTIGRQSSR